MKVFVLTEIIIQIIVYAKKIIVHVIWTLLCFGLVSYPCPLRQLHWHWGNASEVI